MKVVRTGIVISLMLFLSICAFKMPKKQAENVKINKEAQTENLVAIETEIAEVAINEQTEKVEKSETVTMDTEEAVQNIESVELISESSNTAQPDIQETQQENDAVDEQNINDANAEETVTIAYPD